MRVNAFGLLSAAAFVGILVRTAAGAAVEPAPPQPAAPVPALPAPRDRPYPGHIVIAVDTSNIAQGIFAVHETIPVSKGAGTTLLYPEWRPGNHSPTGRGRIARVAGLVITAGGKPIAWTRDPVNVFAFHVPLPSTATAIDVDFQYLAPPASEYGRPETSPRILTLDWDAVTLYPAGFYARQITVDARLKVPAGWQLATALDRLAQQGDEVRFGPTTFETLVDSPVYAGAYTSTIDLDPGAGVPVHLDLFADRPELLEATPEQLTAHRNMIQQAYRLFGAHHYDHYDFLVSLSDVVPPMGVEHHRSSFDGLTANYLTEWDKSAVLHALLSHEFVHSWNGKFRRPADLWTPNYNVPMRDSLLWVYEGQTQYWGNVLAARSQLLTPQQSLDLLAMVAAQHQVEPGRDWRSLADTTDQPIIQYYSTPQAWPSWQRGVDYYNVGSLIWLDADTLIREQSHGQRSLDDFARQFFGMDDGSYGELPYTFDDVVTALNRVQAYDWATFLHQRIDAVKADAPINGITRGGYRLVFTDQPSALNKSSDELRKLTSLTYSVGLSVDKEGVIKDVLWNGPAFKAGLAPGSRIIAVDDLAFDVDQFKATIKASPKATAPISLIVREADRFATVRLDYHAGLRYPHLERDPDRPDLLQAIFAPKQ
jgi:predicted metalloprotease with PDZ domain